MSATWDREDELSKMPNMHPHQPDYEAKANEDAGCRVGPQKGPSSASKIEAERKALQNWLKNPEEVYTNSVNTSLENHIKITSELAKQMAVKKATETAEYCARLARGNCSMEGAVISEDVFNKTVNDLTRKILLKENQMEFSERGIPTLTIREKCDALAICLENGDHEDAEGHIWDLLSLAMGGFVPDKWAKFAAYRHGKPTPIKNSASD